jgi:hypothetical protein
MEKMNKIDNTSGYDIYTMYAIALSAAKNKKLQQAIKTMELILLIAMLSYRHDTQ